VNSDDCSEIFANTSVLLGGAITLSASMAIVGAVSASTTVPSGALANLVIAAMFLWVIGFSVTWGTVVSTLQGEIPANTVRQKTTMIGFMSSTLVNLIVVFVSPYSMLSILGFKQS